MGQIRIGVAGWDYADWNGIVYPAGAPSRFDRLDWISRYVDVVEVNTSFYRPVAPRVAESWVRRTRDRPGFCFTAKSHRCWTHEPATTPREAVPPTLEGLRPLREADRLGALLVQFPQSFHLRAENLDRIEQLRGLAADWPLVVEVRHISWDGDETEAWFAERAIGWCLVDQPRVGGSTLPPLPRVTSPVAYMRMHGRNSRDWFRPDAGRDARYDYRYSTDQLGELAVSARRMSEQSKVLYAIQNNHFRGQALVNALQLKHVIEQTFPPAPEELVHAYPDLASQVSVRRSRLF